MADVSATTTCLLMAAYWAVPWCEGASGRGTCTPLEPFMV